SHVSPNMYILRGGAQLRRSLLRVLAMPETSAARKQGAARRHQRHKQNASPFYIRASPRLFWTPEQYMFVGFCCFEVSILVDDDHGGGCVFLAGVRISSISVPVSRLQISRDEVG